MPFITTERVKEIRNQIKKEFPEFSFSIRTRHSSTVVVDILAGPLPMPSNYQQVNHYYIANHYEGSVKDMLLKIKEIANEGNYIESESADYGNIPSFYLDINIGQWDKSYRII